MTRLARTVAPPGDPSPPGYDPISYGPGEGTFVDSAAWKDTHDHMADPMTSMWAPNDRKTCRKGCSKRLSGAGIESGQSPFILVAGSSGPTGCRVAQDAKGGNGECRMVGSTAQPPPPVPIRHRRSRGCGFESRSLGPQRHERCTRKGGRAQPLFSEAVQWRPISSDHGNMSSTPPMEAMQARMHQPPIAGQPHQPPTQNGMRGKCRDSRERPAHVTATLLGVRDISAVSPSLPSVTSRPRGVSLHQEKQ